MSAALESAARDVLGCLQRYGSHKNPTFVIKVGLTREYHEALFRLQAAVNGSATSCRQDDART